MLLQKGSKENLGKLHVTNSCYFCEDPELCNYDYLWSALAKLRRATISLAISVRLSVCPHGTIGETFIKFDIWEFFEKRLRKFKIYWNRTKIKGTFQEDQYIFFIISHSFLLRTKNVSDKRCRENRNTNFVFRKHFVDNLPFMR